jgi:hypothetical protein
MLRLPELLDNGRMKVVRLSAVRTGLLYPRGDTGVSNVFFLEQTAIRNCYYLNIQKKFGEFVCLEMLAVSPVV